MIRALALALALAAGTATAAPVFDPATLKPPQAVPNRVMVLGTAHLSEIPAASYPASFAPLIERLARFRPEIVTIEAVSGLQCAYLRSYPVRWKSSVDSYCWNPERARVETGLDVPAANAEAERLLAALGPYPAPAQRRRLAAVFLAAGERASALVQWLRLPDAERHADEGLHEPLVRILELLRVRHNEDYAIAAPLAARLGLERVYATDDHSSDFTVADEAGFEAAMRRVWDNPAIRARKAVGESLVAGAGTAEGLMALYRGLNDPGGAMLIYRSDFGAALGDRSSEGFGRRYLGGWETRNLRMVANIRDVLAQHPGSRLLTIVGGSHKFYFEAYLRQMHDIEIVDAETVLR